MKKSKISKLVIIGAGVSGLSAGIYGQKHGFITEIYEKNPKAGGLCFAWQRKNMNIDGCIHWLTGTRDGDEINTMWHDVDAFDQEDIINGDNFGSIEYKGKIYTFWCDLSRLEKELIEISPKDKKLIKKFIKYTILFAKMPLPMTVAPSLMSLGNLIKFGISMIPYLPSYIYAIHTSQYAFAKRFKSEELRYVLSHVVPGDGNLYTTLYAFGSVALGNGGVPKGGSNYIVKRMENEYLRLGGIINYSSEISTLVNDGKKISKAITKDGKEINGDYFITCIDAYEATRMLIKTPKKEKNIVNRFIKKEEYPLPTCLYCSYKVDVDKLKALNVTTTFEFSCNPFKVATKNIDSLKIRNYLYDNTFIKDNKVLITVLIHQNDKDYYYWENLHNNIANYNKTKNDLGNHIKEAIIKRFPSLQDSLELIDVATPMTYRRYVNAHRGAYMSWSFTSDGKMLIHNQNIYHLKNLCFSGQWIIMPGGLPIALLSGKFAIQKILKKEHRPLLLKVKKGKLC